MKPEEINRAIAELCGWEFVPSHDQLGVAINEYWNDPDGERCFDGPPDYFHDLNACASFDDTLKFGSTMGTYLEILCKNGDDQGVCWTTRTYHSVCATAPQRCEAFLRLHGKWREE